MILSFVTLLTGPEPAAKRARSSGPVVWQVNGGGGGQPRLLPRPAGSVINNPGMRFTPNQPVFPNQIGPNPQKARVLELVPVSGPVQNNQGKYTGQTECEENLLMNVKEELYDPHSGSYGGVPGHEEDLEEEISDDDSMDHPASYNMHAGSLDDSGIMPGRTDGSRSVRIPFRSVLEQLKHLESRVKSMEGRRTDGNKNSEASSIAKQLKALESRVLSMENSTTGNSLPTLLENRLSRLEKRIEETYDTLNRKLSETQVTVDKIYAVLLNKF